VKKLSFGNCQLRLVVNRVHDDEDGEDTQCRSNQRQFALPKHVLLTLSTGVLNENASVLRKLTVALKHFNALSQLLVCVIEKASLLANTFRHDELEH
jgi:hypothetical protein